MTRQPCVLCGHEGDVRTALIAWKEPATGRIFDVIPRCTDRPACRERVVAAGEAWPLDEGVRVKRRIGGKA